MSRYALMWIVFNIVIAAILYVDLRVFARSGEMTLKKAALACSAWISLALLFCAGIYFSLGSEKSLEFLAGYIIEYTLSMDNMFVFLLIFTYFGVPRIYQHRVLCWGIMGAIVMRFILIFAGVALVHAFEWIMYVFGAILIYSAFHMIKQPAEETNPAENLALKLAKKIFPFKDSFDGEKFFVRENGKLYATLLFATLVVIEASDLVFALDSIPAILAITTDRFIVYTSNVFAIIGLRALYFLLAGLMGLFRYLKYGIAAILVFVGVKMLVSGFFEISAGVSLAVVAGMLAVSILSSVLLAGRMEGADGK